MKKIILTIALLVLLVSGRPQSQTQLGLGVPDNSYTAAAITPGNGLSLSLPTVSTQVTWLVTFAVAPDSITLQIQTSLDNINWVAAATSNSVSTNGGTINTSARFIRCSITAAVNGSGITCSLIAKSALISASLGTDTYALYVQALLTSPVDAATVFFGNSPKSPITSPEGANKMYIPRTGTVTGAIIYVYSSGTSGSNEDWALYVRKNATTDFLIQSLAVTTNERVFSNLAMNIPVVVGDYLEVKGVQPTWVTNPTNTTYGGQIFVQ